MPERIENAMVLDWWWAGEPSEAKKKSDGAGYEEIGTGIFVPEEDAYRHALEGISQDDGLRKEFVKWFYSGNWVHEDGNEKDA